MSLLKPLKHIATLSFSTCKFILVLPSSISCFLCQTNIDRMVPAIQVLNIINFCPATLALSCVVVCDWPGDLFGI